MSILTADRVGVDFRTTVALESASLELGEGEMVGLIGPNGAGKTTCLRALAGLLPPTRGVVMFRGKDIATASRKVLARAISYLPTGAPCHWPMSVRRVISLGRLPHLANQDGLKKSDESVIDDVMEQADVVQFAERPVTTLSSGERMRVMVARALAQSPKALLADEPVATLDPYHQLRVMELLADLAWRGGGVLAVMHDLSMAARFCDRLVLLVDGAIVAEGTPEAVLTPDRLRAAYGVDVISGQAGSHVYGLPDAPDNARALSGQMESI